MAICRRLFAGILFNSLARVRSLSSQKFIARNLSMQSHKAPTAGVIFLHGSGDTGAGLRDWLNAASGRQFESHLVSEGIKVVFPTAPLRPYSLAGGELSHVWHDRKQLSFDATPDDEGAGESIRLVEQLMAEFESEGIDKSKVVIGGFSMGGSLTLQCLSRPWAQNMAGFFSLSSFLVSSSHIYSIAPPLPPLYISHGVRDGLVPVQWGFMTAERLKSAGHDIEYVTHRNLDHELSKDQLSDLSRWIKSRLLSTTETQDNDADAHAASITYTIAKGNGNQSIITFTVPPHMVEPLCQYNLAVRGAYFEVCPGDRENIVTITVESPTPDVTARALLEKIQSRIRDPTPPGAENCVVA